MGKDRGAFDESYENILRVVRAAAPGLSPETLSTIARGLYQDLGGTRPYYPKAPARGKEWSLGDAITAGVPFAQAWKKVGISRATAFRVRRRWMRAA